jgi:hypothetical protein
MTPEDVQRVLHSIRDASGDDEVAHGMEDGLYGAVLLAIADGTCTDPRECARLALMTKELKFQRWCA